MVGEFDHLERPSHVVGPGRFEEVAHRRVLGIVGAEDFLCLSRLVGLPERLDRENGEHHAFGIAEGEPVAVGQALGGLRVDVEGDRDGPQRSVGKPHVADDPVVFGLGEEARQRREPAGGEQLQIAQLPVGEIPGDEVDRGFLERRGLVGGDEQVDEVSAVRWDEVGGRHR